jgi:S-adenosylmethionine hydrolase
MGKKIVDYARAPFATPRPAGCNHWCGCVLHIDRFGNLVTNLQASDFPDLRFVIKTGGKRVTTRAKTDAEGRPRELFVITGSTGYLEISVNQGSAAELVGCQPGRLHANYSEVERVVSGRGTAPLLPRRFHRCQRRRSRRVPPPAKTR